MSKGTRINKLSPLMMVMMGIFAFLWYMVTRGKANPFLLLFPFLAATLELLFRRQNRIHSNLLSFSIALIVVVTLKVCVIDFMVVRTDRLEGLGIPKDAKVVVQKSFWKIVPGDVVVVKPDSDTRNYVGEVKEVSEGSGHALVSGKNGSMEQIQRNRIAGKVIYVFESQ